MRPQDASLDMIDVDLTPPEPFHLVDEQEQETTVAPVNGDGADEKTPEEEPAEERISRRDRRINYLIARAKDAEERAAALEASLELERQERERAREADTLSDDERSLDEQLAAIDAQIASESDDPAMQSVLKANRLLLQRERSRSRVQKQEVPTKAPSQPSPAQTQVHPAAQDWLQSNAWYQETDEYNRPKHPTLASEATNVYHRLRATYGMDSKELFDELNRELAQLPEFERVLKKPAKPPERPTRQNTAPANVHATDARAPENGAARENALDRSDKAKLRALGKDPDDPKVRAAYIKYNPRKFKGASL